jgi:hypothetical protein
VNGGCLFVGIGEIVDHKCLNFLFIIGHYSVEVEVEIISWWSVLLVEETGGRGENHRPAASH